MVSNFELKMKIPNILIAEDERIIALDIKATLNNLGYRVAGIARSVDEVLMKVKETKPNLILMDIILEGTKTGIDAANSLKSENDIPIIFITASTDSHTLELAQATKPIDILNKPFSSSLLAHSINKAFS